MSEFFSFVGVGLFIFSKRFLQKKKLHKTLIDENGREIEIIMRKKFFYE